MAKIADADEYFTRGCGRCERFATSACSVRAWQEGLGELRRICREVGLSETLKWSHPAYRHAERNIAVLGAFRGDFRITFMNPTLLEDTHGLLERRGPDCVNPGSIRFDDVGCVRELEPVLRAYLRQLMDHAERGTRPVVVRREVAMPDELAAALDADAELARAFHALTPGRQRGYRLEVGRAKRTETRLARIAKHRAAILAGKGPNER